MKLLIQNSKAIDRVILLLTILQFSLLFILEGVKAGIYFLLLISFLISILSLSQNNGILPLRIQSFHLFVFGFGLYSIVSSLWALNPKYAMEKGVTILEILICFLPIYMHYQKKNKIDILIKAIMWGCFVVMGYAILALGWSSVLYAIQHEGRMDAGFTNINSLGMIISISIVFSVYFMMKDGFQIWNLLIVPAVFIIAASGSRKAVVISIVGIGVLLIFNSYYNNRNFFIRILKILLIIGLVIIGVYLLSRFQMFAGVNSRMRGLIALITGEGEVDSSALIRSQMIQIGWRQFLHKPIFGIGMGNARIINMTSLGRDTYLHNNYVELLVNGGIVGFLLYYSMYLYNVYYLIKFRKCNEKYALLCLSLIISLLISDYGVVSYYSKSTYYFFILFFICSMNLKKRGAFEACNEISQNDQRWIKVYI